MKVFLILVLIHVFAYSVAKAEEARTANSQVDDCKDLLPQVESDYQELEGKYQTLRQNLPSLQDSYLSSFNEMTQVLFQLTQAREEETQKISESRDQLKAALQSFNEQKTSESSMKLQESYLSLTVRLYTSMAESQKSLETLKSEVSKVESSRSLYTNSKTELDQMDNQKLAVEAKLVNLKIKCPSRKY